MSSHQSWEDRLRVAESAWIAPGAVVVGQVSIEDRASVWYGCVIRGDLEPITIGAESNVQDLTLIHVDRDLPTTLGRRVTVGHGCIVHGCTVEDGATLGMGAVVLSGARIGAGAVVAAGAVVREGMEVPPRTWVAGVPASVRGDLTDERIRRFDSGVDSYLEASAAYRSGRIGARPFPGGAR